MANLEYKRFMQFKKFLISFLPSKYVLLVGAISYICRLIFALVNLQAAQSSFTGEFIPEKLWC